MKIITAAITMLGLVAGFGARAQAATSCEDLKGLSLAHTEITAATVVAGGSFTLPPGGGPPNPNAAQQAMYKALPAFCRVKATLRPSADSDIKMEVWLPTEGWNGRLQAVGNGGFQARISFNNLAAGVQKGYAITGNDTGHEGDNGDGLIGHPEKLKDWGYRAVHENVVAAKAIMTAYYGNGPKYSYYAGCSTGGRQGWVAAEYYPEDFDGLAIGDPANPMTRLQAGSIWSNLVLNKTPEGRLNNDDWTLVRNAVMQQCDARDGLKDGLIQNPLACNFKTRTLSCKNGASAGCLTAAKIEVLDKITRGAVNSAGRQVYPGWPAGTLFGPVGPIIGVKAQQDAVDTFRVLFGQPDWDYHTFDIDRDVPRADMLGDNVMNAVDPKKLQPLLARGGKVILYHGWHDPAITPLISINLYKDAVAANGGLGKTYNQMRLFMVPAMSHCGNGDGPNAFDKLDPLTDWVEKGKAPDQIVASHSDASGKVVRTRPLCPYPRIAKYKGSGSIDEAQNFSCANP